MIKKIVIIGPESTGKSSLCKALADHFAESYLTDWCPEYAREYLMENGMDYSYDDLLTIAKGQLALEDEHTRALQAALDDSGDTSKEAILFVDTDMMVMKVWSEFVFGKCHSFILDQIAERQYDGYLLANTDLPWTRDALREYPSEETRQKLFYMYLDMMVNQNTRWDIVGGINHDRIANGIAAVNRMLI